MPENVKRQIKIIDHMFENLGYESTNQNLDRGIRYLADFMKIFANGIINLENDQIEILLKIILRCCAICHWRVNYLDSFFKKRRKIKQGALAFDLYKKIIFLLHPKKTNVLVDIIVSELDASNYIYRETLSEKYINIFLSATNKNLDIINILLDKISIFITQENTVDKALSIFKWMSDLVTSRNWPFNDKKLLMRFLDMHISSIIDIELNPNVRLLREGIEICMKRIIRRLSQKNLLAIIEYVLNILVEEDFIDEYIIYIAYCLELASMSYKVKSVMQELDYSTLNNILLLIGSSHRLKCALGNQTFQNIMDVNNNKIELITPRIYFTEMNYNIRVKKTDVEWNFIQEYRQELNITFINALITHKNDISLIRSIHTSIAVLITEFPCAYTSAFAICMLMTIQKKCLLDANIVSAASHRLHAVIICLISLICWIMEAKVLYNYLNAILKERAHNAPFLNPPLKEKYHYANHYKLWNKPQFFFVDFEVRYALWKRFRLKENSEDAKTYELVSIKYESPSSDK